MSGSGGGDDRPVEIDGKKDRVRDVVTVGVADSSVRLVEQPLSATVVIEILRHPSSAMSRRAGPFRNLAASLEARITPAVVRVSIRGQRDVVGASARIH